MVEPKYHRGDVVYIEADLGPRMQHKTTGEAVSYLQQTLQVMGIVNPIFRVGDVAAAEAFLETVRDMLAECRAQRETKGR